VDRAIQTGDGIAREFASRLRASLGSAVQRVYCFGSWARGMGTPDSDVDLLVETQVPVTSAERDQVADIAIDLTSESGYALDVHYYTTRELRSSPYSGTPFVKTVLAEARVV
jgi:predicted nucleotidyltransferase